VLVAALVAVALANQIAARQRDYRVLLMRGDSFLREDDTFRAIEAYSGAIALRPDSMLAYLRRGETYRRRGELEAAVHDFSRAASLDSATTRPLEELGDVSYQLQRYDRAITSYKRSLALDDRPARVYYKLALAHYRAGDAPEALAAVDQAVRLDDHMADAHYLRGICLRDERRTADAMKAFERAIALAPALVPAREELADLLVGLDRRSEEIEQLQLLAGLDRERPSRHVALGLAYARARRWDAAVLTLGSALERIRDPLLYQALGQVWLESARARDDHVELRKAREALEPIAASPGATSHALTLAGEASLADGDVEGAERTLQLATERYPVDPAAMLVYATVAERRNHFDAARRALIQYEALVSTDPEFVARATKIAALSIRVNDPEAANEWIKRGLDRDPQNGALIAMGDRVKRASLIPGTPGERPPLAPPRPPG
jgi:tetratricopeptide (TPR) repeat protein